MAERDILTGPEENYGIPLGGSIGKYFLDCLKARGRDEVINIDATTGSTLTCGQLIEEVMNLVCILKTLGIKKGDVITIISENTIRYCIPLISGLYMGVAVNLLNPSYSAGELRHALDIAKPKIIFCSESALSVVNTVRVECQCVNLVLLMGSVLYKVEYNSNDKVPEEIFASMHTETNIEPDVIDAFDDVALILLSSGTTGLPKGVLLTHNNLRIPIGVLCDNRYPGINSNDVICGVLPYYHVFGTLISFSVMVSSAKIVVLSKFHPELFLSSIQKYSITILSVVPPILFFIAKSPIVKSVNLSTIRYVLCGAAPLSKDVQAEAAKVLNLEDIYQGYGTTELSGVCSVLADGSTKPGSVGRLIPNLQLKVWDNKKEQTVGPNEVGEFCFKGSIVMKGYLGETNTDEVIDENGFYHSGDVGYYDEEGYLYIVDRSKDLIKYKGFQVAPAEIENILLTHPSIKDCAVIGVQDAAAGEVPVAYVVRESGSTLTEKDVIQFVAERISKNKQLHGGVKFVEQIPRNASGKLLRRIILESYTS